MTLDERVYRGTPASVFARLQAPVRSRDAGDVQGTSGAATGTLRGRVSFLVAVLVDLGKSVARERVAADPIVEHAMLMPLGSLGYDLRQAWRMLTRAPALAVFVTALMALSIGATTAAFSVVNTVLLRPFPFARPDRLVMVWGCRGADDPRNVVGAHELPEWQARSRSFDRMAGVVFDRDFDLDGRRRAHAVDRGTSHGRLLPCDGRDADCRARLRSGRGSPRRGQVVIISERLWRVSIWIRSDAARHVDHR